jgi:hypothetical protein
MFSKLRRFFSFQAVKFAILFPALVVLIISLETALFANGYEDNPPPVAWSPANNVLVAAINDELWIVDVLGYADILASGGVSSPTFSQDGFYLAFVQNGSLRVYDWILGIYIDVETGGDVIDCAFDRSADDDKATHMLYFTAGPLYYGCDIFKLDVDSGVLYEVTDEGDASASAPVPNPYKDEIALVLHGIESPGGYEQLHLLTGMGRTPKAATGGQSFGEYGYHESNPIYIDANTIIFQRGGWGDWTLYKLNTTTGREEIFLPDAQQPSMSRYRGIIAFTRRNYFEKMFEEYDWDLPPSVWVKYTETGETIQISPYNVWSEFPAVSADGTHIAWVERCGELERVAIRTLVDAVG